MSESGEVVGGGGGGEVGEGEVCVCRGGEVGGGRWGCGLEGRGEGCWIWWIPFRRLCFEGSDLLF